MEMVKNMGGFKIHQDNYADFTVVSNRFIDDFMEDANDAQLKIYLYLMRMTGANLPTGISDIADRFNYTEKDVLRALHYWEKKHLLELEYDELHNLCGVHMLPVSNVLKAMAPAAQTPIVQVPAVPTEEPKITVVKPAIQPIAASAMDMAKPQYTKDDLLRFKSGESSAELVFIAEQYLRKTLSVAELGTLFYLSDTLHFSNDLIDYLLQYCVGRDKTDHRYIEAVALDWAQSGITTPKQAAAHARKYDRIVYDIMNALGKSSNPSNVEVSLINKWTRDFSYDMGVISVACERTVLNTDKKRFSYADSILTRWYELGIRHKGDIESLDPPRKKVPSESTASSNKFNQFAQNTYDYEALEKAKVSN